MNGIFHLPVNGQNPYNELWGYFPSEGHPEVITKFEGTKATPEFLQAIAYEVYVRSEEHTSELQSRI